MHRPSTRNARLVVGLGNPGPEYAETRHNVGFQIVERWVERHAWSFEDSLRLEARVATGRVGDSEVAALLPQTYMNRSGRSVARAIEESSVSDPGDLLVIYDDLDLPLGRLRLRPGGGAGGHRGLGDIQAALGRDDFPRLRVGIGRPEGTAEVVDYVLSPFAEAELECLGETLERAVEAIDDVLQSGTQAAMNRVNAAPPSRASERESASGE